MSLDLFSSRQRPGLCSCPHDFSLPYKDDHNYKIYFGTVSLITALASPFHIIPLSVLLDVIRYGGLRYIQTP